MDIGKPVGSASMSIETEAKGVCRSTEPPSLRSSKPLLFDFLNVSLPNLEHPLAYSQSPYCLYASKVLDFPEQCFSSCPRTPQRKQKVGSLSYLKVTQNFSPFRLTILPPFRSGLSMGRSTRILMNLACSDSQDRLSVSMYFPNRLPRSLPTSSNIFSKGRPQT